MSAFTFQLTSVPEHNTYRLIEDYIYQWHKDDTLYKIRVPKLFEFDASIPRIAWTILGLTPGHPKILNGACVHDWLYKNGGAKGVINFEAYKGASWEAGPAITKEQADKLFFRIMRENGVKQYKRRLAYRAVKYFGGSSWKSGS